LSNRPFGNEVTLTVGDVVFWDDREGWRGKVTSIHSDGFIRVEYDNGEMDARIDPAMFTVQAKS
jgi:hypothetical protein